MSPMYRIPEEVTGIYDCRWGVWSKVDGYQEPRPSELRHHWIQGTISGPAGTGPMPVVCCARCDSIMDRNGGHNRTCFGAGRP